MASKAGKWVKRIFIGIGALLLIFIIAAITLPIVFKKQILESVKSAANEQLNATVDFKDVSLSLIWTFPNFSFSLQGLTVTGKEEFEGLKLADVENISLRLNLWKVIGGEYVVNGLEVDQAKLYVKVLNNGKANYDIVKSDGSTTTEEETSSESSDFKLGIRYYAINNADLIYDDAVGGIYTEIKNLTHRGSGDLGTEQFDFFTKTTIDAITVKMDRIAYLNKAKVDAKINLGIEMTKEKMLINLLDNSIKLNALELNAEGGIEMKGDDINFKELKLNTPSTSFAAVLSMIPAAYTKDFSGVKTNGAFNFDANVNGTYNATAYPAFAVNLGVQNADFQYPDLPMGVKNINTKIAVNSKSSDLDQMTIDVSKFHMELGSNPFDATLKLRTPMSDPDVDTKVDGKINLDELSKAFPMEGMELSGLIEANLVAKTKLSYVEKQAYDKVDMKGLLGISKMVYKAAGMPDVLINNMKMDFTPNNVNLEDFDLKIGKSDIKANGKLDNILTYFSRDKIMTGNLVVRSNLLDLDEMMGPTDTTASTDANAATNMVDTTSAPPSEDVFDRWDFAADFECKQMKYDVYDIKDIKAKGAFSPSRAKMSNFEMLIGKVDMKANGELNNVFGYLYDNELLKGELNLYSNYMNLNQFMTETGEATEPAAEPTPADPETVETEYEPIIVPANLDLHLTSTFNTLIYDIYKLKNVYGDLRVKDAKVEIVNLECNAFGGSIALNGVYNTQNPEVPKFAFGYNMANLAFEQVAEGMPFITYFVPVMNAMIGRFNSSFKINGDLAQNLYPKMNTINAEGLLETFNATLKGAAPLQGLSDKMKIKELSAIAIKNTKNFFKIEDGKFIVEPFAFNHAGIDMTFGGGHGLDQKMDYDLKMRVPRKLLDKAGLGNAADAGMKAIQSQASKLGIAVNDAEYLNFGVDVGGTTSKPTFSPKLLGAEGKSGESLGDQVKESLKEEAEKIKQQAEDKVKEETEKLKQEAEERARKEAERLAEEAKEKARKEAERLAAKAATEAEAKRIRDSIEAEAKRKAEEILKNKNNPLKNNPFKGKNPFKKGGG
jgi:hypothetical protein